MNQKWIDISFWQGSIDWAALKKDCDGVVIKACEGSWVDKKFAEYRKAARAVKLPVQYYAFYRPWMTGAKQAALFWKLIMDDPGDLPPVIDLEAGVPEASPVGVSASALSMARDLTILGSGRKPWIYTAKWFMDRLLQGCWTAGSRERRVGWMKDYELWLAAYPWERRKDFVQNYSVYENLAFSMPKPAPIYPFQKLAAWQFTGHGRVDGIRGDADINVFYKE